MESLKKLHIWQNIQYINENIDYLYQTRVGGNLGHSISFLKKYSLESENFYIGNIPNEYIRNDYFDYKDSDWKKIIEYSFSYLLYYNETYDFTQVSKYRFFKWVDLAKSWIIEGFYGMAGAHWNPRIKKIIIHPGGQRFFIFNLFPIRNIQYIFWNTNGIQLDFMKDMEEVDVESLYLKYKHNPGGLTFDHGSIIPHPIHQINYPLNENVEASFNKIYKFIKENKFYINIDIDILDEFYTKDKSKSSYIIEIKNKEKNLYKSILKSLLLYVNSIDYEDEDIKVYVNK